MEADVAPINVTWLYHGQSCTPKVKLSNYGLSMWMSFHHMVLRLSPRACVAAFLKWFIEKLRAFEARPATRGLLIGGEAVSDKITGIDFISSLPPAAEGRERQPIPFYHPSTQWMVVLTKKKTSLLMRLNS